MDDLDFKKIKKTISKRLLYLRIEFRKETQQEVVDDIGSEKLSLRTYKSFESGK